MISYDIVLYDNIIITSKYTFVPWNGFNVNIKGAHIDKMFETKTHKKIVLKSSEE